MAQEGELVKLGNGRWARFRQLPVYAGEVLGPRHPAGRGGARPAHAGVRPEAAEVSLDAYRLRGFEMDVRLDADGNVRFEQRPSLH